MTHVVNSMKIVKYILIILLTMVTACYLYVEQSIEIKIDKKDKYIIKKDTLINGLDTNALAPLNN